jgi:hypothetical protein
MPGTLHDVTKAATVAAQNQLRAQQAAQSTAAMIAAQRAAQPPAVTIPAEGQAAGAQ